MKYTCLECGHEFERDQTDHLPVCPICGEVVEAAQ